MTYTDLYMCIYVITISSVRNNENKLICIVNETHFVGKTDILRHEGTLFLDTCLADPPDASLKSSLLEDQR